MRTFKVLASAALIMILSITFMGCGSHIIKEKIYKEKGKEIAQNYIKDKYGFEGNITNVRVQRENGSILDNSPPPTGKVHVDIEHDGVKFQVYVDAKNDDEKCYDNYQKDEIEKAAISKVSKCAGMEPAGYKFCYGALISASPEYNGMVDLYFDGSNLDDVLNSDGVQVVAIFEFNGISDFDSLNNLNFPNRKYNSLLLVNYRDDESIGKVTTHDYGCLVSFGKDYTEKCIYENAMYIKNARLIKDGSNKDFFNHVKESSGIYYLNSENNDDIYFSIAEAEDISNWNGKGIGPGDGRIATPCYKIEKQVKDMMNNNQYLYIFYPAEKLDKNKEYRVGLKYSNGDEESFDTCFIDLVGDYYYFTVSEYNMIQSFTIIEVNR